MMEVWQTLTDYGHTGPLDRAKNLHQKFICLLQVSYITDVYCPLVRREKNSFVTLHDGGNNYVSSSSVMRAVRFPKLITK